MARTWPRDGRPRAILLAGAVAMTIQALVIPRLDLAPESSGPRPYRLFLQDEAARIEWQACLDAGGTWDACFARVGYTPPDTTVVHSST